MNLTLLKYLAGPIVSASAVISLSGCHEPLFTFPVDLPAWKQEAQRPKVDGTLESWTKLYFSIESPKSGRYNLTKEEKVFTNAFMKMNEDEKQKCLSNPKLERLPFLNTRNPNERDLAFLYHYYSYKD